MGRGYEAAKVRGLFRFVKARTLASEEVKANNLR